MITRITQRINGILKVALAPVLRSRGFRKRGAVYVAKNGEVTWLVDVQKSRWNDKEEAQFTVNGGVYVPGIVSGYSSRPDPAVPKMLDCCLSVRIGMLDESRVDKWWKITALDRPEDVVDESIAAEVRDRVEVLLLPFLERFTSAAAVAEFFERPIDQVTGLVAPQSSPQRHAYSSLIYSKLGNSAKARNEIEQAINEAKGTPIERVIERIRAEL